MKKLTDWLPTSAKEVKARGWDYLDVILFSGDAYVDHPSFSAAVIGRTLESLGLRVAIVPQPNWQDDLRDFKKLGTPRLFFGVTAGNMDSMVNHYTANKRLRSDDAYTPGNKAGFRPDRATITYTQILKKIHPDVPVIIGGIEASLRRLTHYDYWDNVLKPSILADSGADLLVYGIGEKVITEIARTLLNGGNLKTLHKINQVVYMADKEHVDSLKEPRIILSSYEDCLASKRKYAENFKLFEIESNKMVATTLIEPYKNNYVVVNKPFATIPQQEIDQSYALPYTRLPHPRYNNKGDIPAYEMIKFSVNMHRGCFGGCSFCTISAHQGKFISSRSEESILSEIEQITQMEGFKGNLSDLGGPSANMYGMEGKNKKACKVCARPSCIYPNTCPNLDNDHSGLVELYRKVRSIKGIKHAYIGSGIRYDMFAGVRDRTYIHEVIKYHTSGRLKVAPEHTEDSVLKLMRKPSFNLFVELHNDFHNYCRREGLNYQLVPYCISSHPGCSEREMQALSSKMRGLKVHLEQIQDFTPTPMTLSSAMFYTGIDPYTGEKVYCATSSQQKVAQKEYFFKNRR